MSTIARCIAVCLIPMAALPGCIRDRNGRETLGGVLRTSSIGGPEPTGVPGEPGVLGLDRSAWPAHVFEVPVDGTVHGPVHHGRVRFTDATARQQGLYPTIETALELDGGAGGSEALEGVVGPVVAAGEILWMPVGILLAPPWAERQSPQWLSKRSRQGGWHSGTVWQEGGEVAAPEGGGALVEPAP